MIKIAVIFASGMEEIEALTPTDVLRRAGASVTTYSVKDLEVLGSHGIKILADKSVEQLSDDLDAIIIPGGMPGAINVKNSDKVIDTIKALDKKNKLICAICASPAVVLSGTGVTDNKRVTCYPAPDFIKMLDSSIYTGEDVSVDGNLITANGPKSALKFSLEICKALNVEPKF